MADDQTTEDPDFGAVLHWFYDTGWPGDHLSWAELDESQRNWYRAKARGDARRGDGHG